MKLIESNFNPTNHHIKQFGFVCFFALPTLSWLWIDHMGTLYWLGGIGFLVAILGWRFPHLLKPIFIGFIFVTLPIGKLVGEVMMILIFFGVITPIGLCLQCMKRDVLKRKFEKGESYWEKKERQTDVSRYYRQW